MKIAKMKLYGNDCIQEYNEAMDADDDWIRLSEVVDIKFVDLPPEVVIPPQIDLIDRKIADAKVEYNEVIVEFNEVIKRLQNAKANLLALTHDPDSQN